MADRILTTHVGSLPRTAKLLEFSQKRSLGERFDQAAFDRELKDAVADVVRHQKESGVDLINDGELGHTMGWAYDYGSWWSYVVKRLSGVEVTNTGLWMTTLEAHTKAPLAPKDFIVGNWPERRDMTKFQEAYMDPHSGCGLPEDYTGMTMETRTLLRRDFTYAMRLLREATDSLIKISGSSGLMDDNSAQRCWRDVHAISSHVVMNWDVPAENFGRAEFGLPLNPAYPMF